jgi:hypothetical protein
MQAFDSMAEGNGSANDAGTLLDDIVVLMLEIRCAIKYPYNNNDI